MATLQKKKVPIHLTKFVDDLVFQLPYFMKLLNGESELTREDGSILYRVKRMDEITRIVRAIEGVYNSLQGEKKHFIQLYYYKRMTVAMASMLAHVGESTAKRWKKEFTSEIAEKLGWI